VAADIVRLNWADNGQGATIAEFYVAGGADPSSIAIAMANLSDCYPYAQRQTAVQTPPSAGPYTGGPGTTLDAAQLNFVTAAGSGVYILLIGADNVCYASDGVTVDPTATAPLIAAILAVGTTRAGDALAVYQSGHRTRAAVPPYQRGLI